jgi:hypothetical protein
MLWKLARQTLQGPLLLPNNSVSLRPGISGSLKGFQRNPIKKPASKRVFLLGRIAAGLFDDIILQQAFQHLVGDFIGVYAILALIDLLFQGADPVGPDIRSLLENFMYFLDIGGIGREYNPIRPGCRLTLCRLGLRGFPRFSDLNLICFDLWENV